MKTLKILVSILAAVVAALATAMTRGLFNVSPGAIGFVMAAAGFVSILGIQPFEISLAASKVLSSAAAALGALQLWHAGAVTAVANPHPWVWATVGIAAVLLGVLGKSPITHDPPTAADLPLIPRKP